MSLSRSALALLALVLLGPALLVAQEPLAAGSDGVPVPKKKKHVQPIYPKDALAQGVRGIVILDLVIDTTGRVSETTIIRSIPGLDEAALIAVQQWVYNPVKVDGKPVSVRLTVPITFALKLPDMTRQPGIPPLRQGVTPPWPEEGVAGGSATADVTLEPDGRIGLARILDGEEPWSTALLQALRTWRFSAPPDDATVSFKVAVEFVPGRGRDRKGTVRLNLSGLREMALLDAPPQPERVQTAELRRETAATPEAGPPSPGPDSAPAPAGEPAASPQPQTLPETPAAAPEAPPAPETARPEPSVAQAPPAAPPATPEGPSTAAPAPAAPPPIEATPAEAPATPSQTPAPAAEAPPAPAVPAQPPAPQAPPAAAEPPAVPTGLALARPAGTPPPTAQTGAPTASVAAAAPDPTAPPPVETLSVAPPPLPPENGISAIRGVQLEPGVPDLTRGRRPVSPPMARMAGANGVVEVDFSVSAGGVTTVQRSNGPDVLRPAATGAVESWLFRRTRADRAYLTAVFTYDDDLASAVVKPQRR